jgi:hypothetical protein
VQREARALDGSAGAEGGAAEGKAGGGVEADGALSRSLFDAAGNDDMLFEFLQHMAVGCRRAGLRAACTRRSCARMRARPELAVHGLRVD